MLGPVQAVPAVPESDGGPLLSAAADVPVLVPAPALAAAAVLVYPLPDSLLAVQPWILVLLLSFADAVLAFVLLRPHGLHLRPEKSSQSKYPLLPHQRFRFYAPLRSHGGCVPHAAFLLSFSFPDHHDPLRCHRKDR